MEKQFKCIHCKLVCVDGEMLKEQVTRSCPVVATYDFYYRPGNIHNQITLTHIPPNKVNEINEVKAKKKKAHSTPNKTNVGLIEEKKMEQQMIQEETQPKNSSVVSSNLSHHHSNTFADINIKNDSSIFELENMDDAKTIKKIPKRVLLSELAAMNLTHEYIQQVSKDFLNWLILPPVHQMESNIKLRPITNMERLIPIQVDLKTLISILAQVGVLEASKTEPNKVFDHFILLTNCHLVMNWFIQRKVGNSRMYAISLLIKKILMFLAHSQSIETKQIISPSTFPSFSYINFFCTHKNQHLTNLDDPEQK